MSELIEKVGDHVLIVCKEMATGKVFKVKGK